MAIVIVALPDGYDHLTPVIEAMVSSRGGRLVSRWLMPVAEDRVVVKDSILSLPEYRLWKLDDTYVLTGDISPRSPYASHLVAEVLGEELARAGTVIGMIFSGDGYPGSGINALVALHAKKRGAKVKWILVDPYDLHSLINILEGKFRNNPGPVIRMGKEWSVTEMDIFLSRFAGDDGKRERL